MGRGRGVTAQRQGAGDWRQGVWGVRDGWNRVLVHRFVFWARFVVAWWGMVMFAGKGRQERFGRPYACKVSGGEAVDVILLYVNTVKGTTEQHEGATASALTRSRRPS